ncbi:MAG: ISNCY family transposase [Proteobacteria bacterium]|nr:ISNCY family transposase [Pseudomonadota bacterium]
MREKIKKQMPLMSASIDHPQAKELEQINRILDDNPTIYDLAMQDLSNTVKNKTGSKGMSADQVVRTAVVKQMFQFSYKELAFHLVDSVSLRRFCRIGIADKGFKKSVLCKNIKSLSPDTWEAINRQIISYAAKKGVEKGRKVRIDCTVVNSNIHDPSDSRQLWDSVRVLTHILTKAKAHFVGIRFHDHTRIAKRRMLGIQYAKNQKQRNGRYKDLLKITQACVGYAQRASEHIDRSSCLDAIALPLSLSLKHYAKLAVKVIDQTKRRIIHGEQVPASEKIFSIFEPHTDIIIKDRRDTYYGHKICLTGGASNLISDCIIAEGNPADTTLTETMLDRQNEIYGRYPLKVALDGGFASKENLKKAKSKKIKDVCFAKKHGLNVEDMCRSQWVYNRLRNFRAGIEAGISWLKRCFSLWRCTWKGFRSFKSYVWASIVSANLLTLARKQLA